jgi:hypothetical protein
MKPTLLAAVVEGKPVRLLALSDEGAEVAPFAIVGQLDGTDGPPSWASFRRNKSFVEFYSRYMRGELTEKPSILGKARVRPGDYVYVIDKRTPTPQGKVPLSDIVGWYKSASDGAPMAATFEYNKDHLLVTPPGELSAILSEVPLHGAISAEAKKGAAS